MRRLTKKKEYDKKPVILVCLTLLVLSDTGCCGDADVRYKGTVTESADAGYTFDKLINPLSLSPIENVAICVGVTGEECPESKAKIRTNANGYYDTDYVYFGGCYPLKTTITLTFYHRDYQTFIYSTNYESTEDPTYGEKYLNVRMRKKVK